jgi:hypothetical protein
MQPFGSQPATSFVFWLKAHNKTGKPLIYTVAQIVCFQVPINKTCYTLTKLFSR